MIGVDFWEEPAGIHPVTAAGSMTLLPDDAIWLSIWHYDIAATIEGKDTASVDRARMAAPDQVSILGSICHRVNLYGDPNLEMTRRRPAFHRSNTLPPAIAGCQLRFRQGDALVIPTTLSVIDASQDVTDLIIEIMIRTRRLIATPFIRDGNYLVESCSGVRIHRSSLMIEPWLLQKRNGMPDR